MKKDNDNTCKNLKPLIEKILSISAKIIAASSLKINNTAKTTALQVSPKIPKTPKSPKDLKVVKKTPNGKPKAPPKSKSPKVVKETPKAKPKATPKQNALTKPKATQKPKAPAKPNSRKAIKATQKPNAINTTPRAKVEKKIVKGGGSKEFFE